MVEEHGINDMPRGWASENEWNKKVYKKWADMIYRCYNEEFHKTHPTYKDCTVCDRWLTLSNFIEDVPRVDGYDRERFLNGELELDKDKKKDKNKHYIMKYCTWLPKPENSGLAMKGKHHTEETKQKISEAKQGENNPMYGKHHTEETKQKISEAMKGKHHSEETKQKMSENAVKPMKGKFGSDNPSSKQVGQYDKVTLELIKIWDSMMDIERELGIAHQNVSKCCKGKHKSAGGFVWKYVEDD